MKLGRHAFLVALLLVPLGALAQPWPSKPLRFIVPFPPGGFNDVLARTLAAELPKALGQPVVVENRAGANGIIGTEIAAKSPPDGYTLFSGGLPMAVAQSLYKTPFDVTRDFTPLTLGGMSVNLLVVNPSLPVNDVRELVAYARARPGKVNYGSAGNGTSTHLAMELFKRMTGTFMLHIPYKGSSPMIVDMLGGQLDVMFDNMPNVLPHVKAGRMRALAVSSPSRTSLAPEFPTVSETGVPGYGVMVWYGVHVPAGTSHDIVQRLHAECVRILNSADVKAQFAKQGVEVQTNTPEQFAEFLKEEVARWAKVVQEAGIKAD